MTLYLDSKPVAAEYGELLFGEGVLSGIASMQLSPFVARHFQNSKTHPSVKIDFVPSMDYVTLTENLYRIKSRQGKIKAENLLSGFMPKRIGIAIVKAAGCSAETYLKNLSQSEIKKIAALCKNFNFEINGTKDFSDAQGIKVYIAAASCLMLTHFAEVLICNGHGAAAGYAAQVLFWENKND